MLAFLFETFFDMDFYQTLNSIAPNFYGTISDGTLDGTSSSEVVHDFPPSDEPVFILGRKYSSLHELSDIRADIRSLIWVTYRRNFAPIGDSSMTSDSGWGCMLRTGQMVLAQALSRLHLGRDWRWNYADSISLQQKLLSRPAAGGATSDQEAEDTRAKSFDQYVRYRKILKLFADTKTAPYSIHQIALMGQCEGKAVGQWFGPNTVAQVLKKLSIYDKCNDIHIHVAMDNMVFLDDIRKFCKSKIKLDSIRNPTAAAEALDLNVDDQFWRPLVLFIPLRLGLTEINPVYFRALKSTFAFPQSLGILGGRPNHALYFVGCCGDQLVHLDPHTTQTAINMSDHDVIRLSDRQAAQTEENQSQPENDVLVLEDDNDDDDQDLDPRREESPKCIIAAELDDCTYHCDRASRMPIAQLDPSIALGFLCRTEQEFEQWSTMALHKLVHDEQQPLFEIMKERPANWPMFEDDFDLHPPGGASPSSLGPADRRQMIRDLGTNKSKLNYANCLDSPSSPAAAAAAAAASGDAASFTSLESDEDYEIIDF